MARNIDPDVPLSDADRAWLVSRNNHALIRQIDENHGVPHTSPNLYTPVENATNPDVVAGLERRADVAEAALSQVVSWLEAHPECEPDEVAAEDPAKRIVGALAHLATLVGVGVDEDDTADDDDPLGENDSKYSGMTNDDLRGELEDRELSRSGSKAELIARLEENDAEG
jgi:hypothetical protein